MIYVYVIKSKKKNYRYTGITNNVDRRLKQHNGGYGISTKSFAPFDLVLEEGYPNYKDARAREKFLKSGAGRKFLDSLK